jgi:hypothetical protein
MMNNLQQDLPANELFKQLVDTNLEKADIKYGSNDAYLGIRPRVVNLYQKGDYKNAWLTLANFLGPKFSNLSEGNLENQQILRILAEKVNPVVTKADILNLLK